MGAQLKEVGVLALNNLLSLRIKNKTKPNQNMPNKNYAFGSKITFLNSRSKMILNCHMIVERYSKPTGVIVGSIPGIGEIYSLLDRKTTLNIVSNVTHCWNYAELYLFIIHLIFCQQLSNWLFGQYRTLTSLLGIASF